MVFNGLVGLTQLCRGYFIVAWRLSSTDNGQEQNGTCALSVALVFASVCQSRYR